MKSFKPSKEILTINVKKRFINEKQILYAITIGSVEKFDFFENSTATIGKLSKFQQSLFQC